MHETTQDTPGVIAFPPLIYGIPWLVGLGAHALIPVRVLAPGPARSAGIVFSAFGIALAGWGRWAMHRVGTDPNPTKPSTALALGGPFRFTRNPLYLSLTLFYVGLTRARDAVHMLYSGWIPGRYGAQHLGRSPFVEELEEKLTTSDAAG